MNATFRPDWSQAPEWAEWGAISCSTVDPASHHGEMLWFRYEPHLSHGRWVVNYVTGVESPSFMPGGIIHVPIGVDWRTLKAQRPSAEAQP
jgi:hypothetical protein